MEELTFSEFTKRIYIKAPLEQIYECWATPAGICNWFLREAKYSYGTDGSRTASELIAPGDRYCWKWYNWDGEECGEVLHANGRDQLEFSFAGESRVRIRLEQRDDAVLVNLLQYGIPTDEAIKLNVHYGCSNGWTFWLANLKAYLEYGVLLHEREFDLSGFPLAGFEFVNM